MKLEVFKPTETRNESPKVFFPEQAELNSKAKGSELPEPTEPDDQLPEQSGAVLSASSRSAS